jgi:endonuclease YncB( thermonuclease family)
LSQVKIFWDPDGLELASLGTKKYLGTADGDTPHISMPIRMLSIDAPETHYPGNTSTSKLDRSLSKLADWIESGKAPIDSNLGDYLCPRLSTGAAGSLQERQGVAAAKHFEKIFADRLAKPNGGNRNIFLRTSDEKFDDYGRVLAYIAPYYAQEELISMSLMDRATFNLLMVDSGWAAPLPIYPALPKHSDLVLLRDCAKKACNARKGAWAEPNMLTGYEFRMCVQLYTVTEKILSGSKVSLSEMSGWIDRFCVDMSTREIFYPQDYHKVKPYNRIFIWPKDVSEAVARMNLQPPES